VTQHEQKLHPLYRRVVASTYVNLTGTSLEQAAYTSQKTCNSSYVLHTVIKLRAIPTAQLIDLNYGTHTWVLQWTPNYHVSLINSRALLNSSKPETIVCTTPIYKTFKHSRHDDKQWL